jgi:hypothetical protein
LLGKLNELMREVFWGLLAGREHLMFFFPPKKAQNERWEVVTNITTHHRNMREQKCDGT